MELGGKYVSSKKNIFFAQVVLFGSTRIAGIFYNAPIGSCKKQDFVQ